MGISYKKDPFYAAPAGWPNALGPKGGCVGEAGRTRWARRGMRSVALAKNPALRPDPRRYSGPVAAGWAWADGRKGREQHLVAKKGPARKGGRRPPNYI